MTRISIPLTVEERESLRLSAQKAMRDPRDHARFILRSALLGEKSQESKKPSTVSDLTEQAVGRMEIKKVFREGTVQAAVETLEQFEQDEAIVL